MSRRGVRVCVCIVGGPEGVECARIHEGERGGLVTSANSRPSTERRLFLPLTARVLLLAVVSMNRGLSELTTPQGADSEGLAPPVG